MAATISCTLRAAGPVTSRLCFSWARLIAGRSWIAEEIDHFHQQMEELRDILKPLVQRNQDQDELSSLPWCTPLDSEARLTTHLITLTDHQEGMSTIQLRIPAIFLHRGFCCVLPDQTYCPSCALLSRNITLCARTGPDNPYTNKKRYIQFQWLSANFKLSRLVPAEQEVTHKIKHCFILSQGMLRNGTSHIKKGQTSNAPKRLVRAQFLMNTKLY